MTTNVAEMTTEVEDQEIRERVAAIRASWTAEEKAQRAITGQVRRSELMQIVLGACDCHAA